jgi:hypothetical protein
MYQRGFRQKQMNLKKIVKFIAKPSLLNSDGWNPFKYSFKTLRHVKGQYQRMEELEKESVVKNKDANFIKLVNINGLTEDDLIERFYKHISISSLQFTLSVLFVLYAFVSLFVEDKSSSWFFRDVGFLGSLSLFFISFCILVMAVKNVHYAKQIKCKELFSINLFLSSPKNWNPFSAIIKRKV